MDNREIKIRFGLNLICLLIVVFGATLSYLNSNIIIGSLCSGMIPGFVYYMVKYGRMSRK